MSTETKTAPTETKDKEKSAPEKKGGIFGWFGGGKEPAKKESSSREKTEGGISGAEGGDENETPKLKGDALKKEVERIIESEKSDPNGHNDFGKMSGIKLGELFSGMLGVATSSFWDLGSIRMANWGLDHIGDIARFHQSVMIGSPYEDGDKIAASFGVFRIVKNAVKRGHLSKEDAAKAVNEGLGALTGHVLGRDTVWKRMIAAGLLAGEEQTEKMIETAIHHGMSGVEEHISVADSDKNLSDLMKRLIPNIPKSLVPDELENSLVSPPPSTPKKPEGQKTGMNGNPAQQKKEGAQLAG